MLGGARRKSEGGSDEKDALSGKITASTSRRLVGKSVRRDVESVRFVGTEIVLVSTIIEDSIVFAKLRFNFVTKQ